MNRFDDIAHKMAIIGADLQSAVLAQEAGNLGRHKSFDNPTYEQEFRFGILTYPHTKADDRTPNPRENWFNHTIRCIVLVGEGQLEDEKVVNDIKESFLQFASKAYSAYLQYPPEDVIIRVPWKVHCDLDFDRFAVKIQLRARFLTKFQVSSDIVSCFDLRRKPFEQVF